jgi:uncharacterized membrane protein YgdD (TMEM256/DUF423 family)
MRTALLVEREKTTASIVVRWATALLVLGILTMATSMALAATAGNERCWPNSVSWPTPTGGTS